MLGLKGGIKAHPKKTRNVLNASLRRLLNVTDVAKTQKTSYFQGSR